MLSGLKNDVWKTSSPVSAITPHSSTLAWKIPWMEEPGRLQSMGSLESDTTERLHFHISLLCIGEGNGNPLQCSCLENPRDRGAWWAAVYGVAVYGVAQSRTRLKQLSSSSSSSYLRSCCYNIWRKTLGKEDLSDFSPPPPPVSFVALHQLCHLSVPHFLCL